MRKLFLALVVLSFFPGNLSNAQTVPDNTYYNRLYYTAKVWGFLKYFHSEVAKGNKNWDNVLFQTLANVRNDISEADFNTTLGIMINKAGLMSAPNTQLPIVSDSMKFNLDFKWLNDAVFSAAIKSRLDTVKNWFRPQDNYYVESITGVGNPVFAHDSSFFNGNIKIYPDENVRLLALFRYWNILNYFYPYKNLMDQNWDSTLIEFIPKMVNSTSNMSYHLLFLELATRINDSHAFTYSDVINNNIFGLYSLPLKLQFVENQTVITGIYKDNTALKTGDIIKSINGVDINITRDSLKKIAYGSNSAAINRNINSFIIEGQIAAVRLLIDNNEGQKEITLQRNVPNSSYSDLIKNKGPAWKIINTGPKKYGYVDMGLLQSADVKNMFHDLRNTDGIIFDIRNYPNGTMWDMISYLFYSDVHVADFTVPDIRYPGTLYWITDILATEDFYNKFQKNIFLLFNELTQSQAEFTIMGLGQHPKAVKIGSQTAGADGNVSLVFLPGGIRTYFTGLGTFYADHRQTQRIGIVPDVKVSPTIAGIRAGRDEVLEAALNYNPTDVIDKLSQILDFNLQQNYPNPFNPNTTIEFQLKNSANVKIKVFNMLGQEIETLLNGYENTGIHKIIFNGNHLSSGVYFYTLESNGVTKTRSMVLLK